MILKSKENYLKLVSWISLDLKFLRKIHLNSLILISQMKNYSSILIIICLNKSNRSIRWKRLNGVICSLKIILKLLIYLRGNLLGCFLLLMIRGECRRDRIAWYINKWMKRYSLKAFSSRSKNSNKTSLGYTILLGMWSMMLIILSIKIKTLQPKTSKSYLNLQTEF